MSKKIAKTQEKENDKENESSLYWSDEISYRQFWKR